MLQLESAKGVQLCDGLSRRDFLRVGSLTAGAVGLSLTELLQQEQARAASSRERQCILLLLVGGPSQLDTWDPKPAAPATVRGPFRPRLTKVPGMHLSEQFPLMAQMAERYALVRSVHHEAAPIHETGHQLLQTGSLCRAGQEAPHYGAVVSCVRGPGRDGLPPFVVLPGPIQSTGVSISHGQTAGYLGAAHEPFVVGRKELEPGLTVLDHEAPSNLDPARLSSRTALVDALDRAQRAVEGARQHGRIEPATEPALTQLFAPRTKQAFVVAAEPDDLRARYGQNTFGQSCLLARRLVESGVRLVTVNMFDTVFNEITWDCHADGASLATSLDDYRDVLCPMFDRAYTALLEDLSQRGLLDTTLVLAMGEFGRTPYLNPRGGRDHWPGCWTVLFAGAGVRGGQVVGASDALAAEPKYRPVDPQEIAATVYAALGLDANLRLPGPDGSLLPLVQAAPITELF